MAIKTRGKPQDVEKLAQELADRPYGSDEKKKPVQEEERVVRTSLSLPASMQQTLEDLALENKRSGKELRTVSAIVRTAIEQYLSNNS